MAQKNMGSLDRTIRLMLGLVAVPSGLFGLGGWHGDWLGLALAGLALLVLIIPALSGFCPAYRVFGFSTSEQDKEPDGCDCQLWPTA